MSAPVTTATADRSTDRPADGAATGGALVRGTVAVARPVLRRVLRRWLVLDVAGEEHVPATGGVLLAATHCSHADSLAVGAAVQRPLHFLGSRELAATPVLGAWLPRLGMLPVDRGSADVGLLDDLAALLRDGAAVVVYPEGSRSRDGRVHRPRSGVARLALATGVPVVPVGVTGTDAAWPVDGRPVLRPRGGTRVRFGPAVQPPAPGPAARRGWNDELHAALVALAGRPAADGLAPVGGGGA